MNCSKKSKTSKIRAHIFGQILCILLFCLVFCAALFNEPAFAGQKEKRAEVKVGAYTPPPGSPERKEILDALRQMVKNMSGLDVVFVIKYFKVQDSWAWIQTEPQSADGKSHYEPISGLLKKENGAWKYLYGPPEGGVCEEDPDCADPERFFRKLKSKYPSAPPGIFPK